MRPLPEPRGFRRHLDGWQAGLIVLVIAGSAILLAVPRAVEPEDVPMPAIDWAALRATTQQDDQLAVVAQTKTLEVDVRAVGTAFRTYNRVVAKKDNLRFVTSRQAVAEAARKVLMENASQLLVLRAYQTTRFVEELRAWEKSGETSDELIELSGDFIDAIKRNAWCELRGDARELRMPDDVLRVMYKKRWNDIIAVRLPEFALTLDEDRVRHAFLIQHPFRKRSDIRPGVPMTEAVLNKRRLESVERLGTRDESYPTMLARGIVLYQAGSYARAVSAFRSYLASSPDGLYGLRAQNYLKAALDRANETGGL